MLRRNRNCFQFETGCKRIRTNLFNGIGDGDGGQGRAQVERAVTDGGNGIGDADACQGRAQVERAVTDGGNRIGDGDTGQKLAVVERAVSNSSNPLRNVISCVLPSFRIRNKTAICFTE